MRKITVFFFCILIFLLCACSPKFQTEYKLTEKEECNEFFDFLKKEFYRDKKGVLRTSKICDTRPCSVSKESFDSLIVKPFFGVLWGHNLDCDSKLQLYDFYATLGKPNFIGIHPVHKYISCVYFISAYPTVYCPSGEIDPLGFYSYKSKMGYQISPCCHVLEILIRPKDNSVATIRLW